MEEIDNLSLEQRQKILYKSMNECCKVIVDLYNHSEFRKIHKLYESNLDGIKKFWLYNRYSNLNESIKNDMINGISIDTPIKPNMKNPYSYFKKIQKMIDTYDMETIQSLNEDVSTDIKLNTFKESLNKIISQLETIDDTNLDKQVLSIKLFTNSPLYVLGYKLSMNIDVKETLLKFGITDNNLFSIIYDKSYRCLYYLSLENMVKYSIEDDSYVEITKNNSYLNFINEIKKQLNTGFDNNIKEDILRDKYEVNYIKLIKEFLGINNLIEIYCNKNIINIKFVDNIYSDNQRIEFYESFKKRIVKD